MSRLLSTQRTTGIPTVWLALVAAATVVDGVLAGASLDQSIKQLPARHRIGNLAFSAYSRASDQANGVIWYAVLGIGGAVMTLAAATSAFAVGTPASRRRPVVLAGCLAIAHSFTTARAAPINFTQRQFADDEAALRGVFERFERWQNLRAGLQLATFLAMVWAIVVTRCTSAEG